MQAVLAEDKDVYDPKLSPLQCLSDCLVYMLDRVYPEMHPSQDPEDEQPLQLLRLDPLQQRLPCTKQSGKRCKSVGLEMVTVQGQTRSDKAPFYEMRLLRA